MAKKHSGSKYIRTIYPVEGVGEPIRVDVYNVLTAFDVKCPARAHAIKKLLCSGIRGKGYPLQDLRETIDAVNRAIELQEQAERAIPCPLLTPEQRQAVIGAIRSASGTLRPTSPEEHRAIVADSPPKFDDTPIDSRFVTGELGFFPAELRDACDAEVRAKAPRTTPEPMGAPRHYD